MIKNNLKKTLIFGILFIFTSCSEELYEDTNLNKSKISVQEKKFDKLIKEKDFNRLIRNISGNSIVSRSIFENQNGFTISNNNVKIIQTDSIVSYTMLIERDIVSDSTVFENLVIQENNFNTTKTALLYKYTSNGATPTQHNSFAFNGIIEKNLLEYSNFNKASYDNTIQTDGCSAIVLMCNESSSGGIGSEHVATGICNSIHHLYFKVVEAICPDSGGSTGGGSSDGDTSGSGGSYDYGDPYSSGGGTNGGTGSSYQNTTDTNQDVVTSPVKPGLDGEGLDETPCSRMEKNSNNIKFREKLKELYTITNFNEVYETGYYEKYDGTFNYMSGTSLNPSLGTKPGMTSYMHVHMNHTEVNNEDGTQTINYSIKMPSPGDIASLTTCAGNALQNNLSPYDSYGVMISNEGIFSVNLTDTNVVLSPALQADMNFSFGMKASKIFGQTLPNSTERKEALQKMLLQLLKNKGLSDKVALYEGEVVIDSSQPQSLPTVKWIKKSLDESGNLIKIPC